MRVLVCGGRNYTGLKTVFATLDKIHENDRIVQVIHGGASGADALGAAWALNRGVAVRKFVARWAKHGESAGPIRNQAMIDKGFPDLVVAFPGGAGTADMMNRAKSHGIKLIEVAE